MVFSTAQKISDGINGRYGTVFSVGTDGGSFSNVYTFTNDSGGAYPVGLLVFQNTLYGVTQGDTAWDGAVFAVNADGTDFTNLYLFPPVSAPDWTYNRPVGALVLSPTALFGVLGSGGKFRAGAVFSLSFPPQLSIVPSGSNFVLSWPMADAPFDYSSYALESATNLASPVWSTNLQAPVFLDGQAIVTNPITKTQQFFRLSE